MLANLLFIALQNPNSIRPSNIVIFDSEFSEKFFPNKSKYFDNDFMTSILSEDYLIIESREHNLKIIISPDSYQIKQLELFGSTLHDCGSSGTTSFDSRTENGAKALSLIRKVDPDFDNSVVIKEPIAHASLYLFLRKVGEDSWTSAEFEPPRDQLGVRQPVKDEDDGQIANGQKTPKGKGYFLNPPYFLPFKTRYIPAVEDQTIFEQVEKLGIAQQIVNERFADALESYRTGYESFLSALLNQYMPELANRLPGKLTYSDLPESLKAQMRAGIMFDAKRYGFASWDEAQNYFDSGGEIEIIPRFAVTTRKITRSGSVTGGSIIYKPPKR